MKIILSIAILFVAILGITYFFWEQEAQYLAPTPVPVCYSGIPVGQQILFDTQLINSHAHPVLLHFFNPACPCSRFNLSHFQALKRKYQGSVIFYAIIPETADLEKARMLLENSIPVFKDTKSVFSKACGVYSTPQAVLLDQTNHLYYRGNYNKSRYCTRKENNYTEIAIQSLLTGLTLPSFNKAATTAYGCPLSLK